MVAGMLLWGLLAFVGDEFGGGGLTNIIVTFIAVLGLAAGTGGVPGLVIDLACIGIGRLRHRNAPPAIAGYPAPIAGATPPPVPVPPDDIWQGMYARCALAVRSVDTAIEAVPETPARRWLVISRDRMSAELGRVERMIRIAREMTASRQTGESAETLVAPLRAQLTKAVDDFGASRDRILGIAEKLVEQPDLGQVQTDLAMLEAELPMLSEPLDHD